MRQSQSGLNSHATGATAVASHARGRGGIDQPANVGTAPALLGGGWGTAPRSERMLGLEEAVPEAAEEGEVVPQQRGTEGGKIVEEAAAPGVAGVEVELHALPHHGPGNRLAGEVPRA